MAYTYNQLSLAYAAVHGGIEPTGEAASQLRLLTNASFSDADRLSYILNSADDTAAVAVLSYQFFTGKAPTAEGMAWLLNSPDNPGDLNDPAYARLNLENRFMNFATNLALQGEAKAAFEGQYGALPYAAYVATIYDSIIGREYAMAAGLDPDATIRDIVGRKDLILLSARNNGVIGPNATAAEIDLALKAATAAYLLAEGIKADIGLFAGATNNFMLAVATGKAVYGADILETYAPTPGSGGTGQAVTNPPPAEDLPGGPQPEPEPEIPPGPMSFTLTAGDDNFTGGDFDDSFTATHLTLNAADVLDGGAGRDTLTITAGGGQYDVSGGWIENIETVAISNAGGVIVSAGGWTGLEQLNITARDRVVVWGGGADVSVDLDQVGQASAIDDVRDLDLTVTGANAAGLLLGYNLALTGSVKVTLDADSAGASGDIYLKGGTSIDITRTATAGGVATFGRVDIEGAANTTSVKVKTTAPGAAVFDTVQITDRSHLPGVATSIRTVEVEGFDDFIFRGQDLETLKLANGSGRIELVPSATASVVTDLGLALDGVHATFADDGDRYDTVNITTTGAASTFDAMRFGALRTLTLDGDARLTVTDASGLTALQRVEITGDASLTADFSNATSLAEIDASAGAGDHVLTIDGRYTAYRGGAGAETLTIGPTQFAQTVVQTIEMGDGDDLMILGDMDLGVGASIDGGAGTDTLRVGSYNAEYRASDIATYTSGFERLEISPVGVMRINLDVLGFRHVAMIDSHPIQVEIAGMRSDDTLELTSSGDNYFLAGAALSGPDDQLNLILRDDAGAGLDFGVVNTAGFEAVNIQLAGPGDTTGRLKLTDLYVMTIVLSGDAGVTLAPTSIILHTLDASGITSGDFGWTAGAMGGSATVKGSATGTNTIDLTAIGAGAHINYTGGTGADIITIGAGSNTIDVGDDSAVDQIFLDGGNTSTQFTTITGLQSGDQIVMPDIQVNTQIWDQPDLASFLNRVANLPLTQPGMIVGHVGDDIYLIYDRNPGGGFQDGVDTLVKLVGVTDLWIIDNSTVTVI